MRHIRKPPSQETAAKLAAAMATKDDWVSICPKCGKKSVGRLSEVVHTCASPKSPPTP